MHIIGYLSIPRIGALNLRPLSNNMQVLAARASGEIRNALENCTSQSMRTAIPGSVPGAKPELVGNFKNQLTARIARRRTNFPFPQFTPRPTTRTIANVRDCLSRKNKRRRDERSVTLLI
jgi:hypothetical protein